MGKILIAELLLNVIKALLLVASAIHLLQMTQSIAFFGLAMILEAISSIFAPIYIGTLIDKYGAIFYYYKILFITFILSILIAFLGNVFFKPVVYIFLAYSLITFFTPFLRLAQQSYFAEQRNFYDLKNINAKHQMAVQFGQILGLLTAAWVVDKQSFMFVHGLSILFLLFSLLCLCGLQRHSNMPPNYKDNYPGIKQLLTSIPKPFLIILILSTFDYLLICTFNLSLAVFAKDYQDKHGEYMSYFDIAYAVGSITLSFFVAKGLYFKGHIKNVILCYSLLPVLFLILLISNDFYVQILCIGLIGALISLSVTAFNTQIQSQISKEVIGRVLAARRVLLSMILFLLIGALSLVNRFGDFIYNVALMSVVCSLSLAVLGYFCTRK